MHIFVSLRGERSNRNKQNFEIFFLFYSIFVSLVYIVCIYISFAGMYSISDSTTGGVQQCWWYIVGIHLVDLCASSVLQAHHV